MYSSIIKEFENRLKEELPAHGAHQKVMRHRKAVEDIDELEVKAKQSAVLILLYPNKSQLSTVFIQRPIYEGVHSGQIALPGGKAEDFDATIEATALREADEELNIKAKDVKVLGKLTPIYVPPSNFTIHPFVAYQNSRPNFIPQESEVADFLECPIDGLLGSDKLIDSEIQTADQVMKVKGFALGANLIWGATAMIVNEFVQVWSGLYPDYALGLRNES